MNHYTSIKINKLKKTRWGPNAMYWSMWPYLETRSLQMELVKMRSTWSKEGGFLNLMTGVFKRGLCEDTERHREENALWRWRKKWEWCGYEPRGVKGCRPPPEAVRGKEGASWEPLRKHSSVNTLILNFRSVGLWVHTFQLFQISVWHFVMIA